MVILLGDGRAVGRQVRPRHALVEPVQAVRSDRGELLRRRLVLDDDRDAPEPVAERRGQPLEGVDDHLLDVEVARIRRQHPETIAVRGHDRFGWFLSRWPAVSLLMAR